MPVDVATEAVSTAVQLGVEFAVDVVADQPDRKRRRRGCLIGLGIVLIPAAMVAALLWFG